VDRIVSAYCRKLDRDLLPLVCYLTPAGSGWHDSNGKPMDIPFGGHRMHFKKLISEAKRSLQLIEDALNQPNNHEPV